MYERKIRFNLKTCPFLVVPCFSCCSRMGLMGVEGIAQGGRSSLLLPFVFALVLWSINLLLMPNISLGIKHLRSQGMWEWH